VWQRPINTDYDCPSHGLCAQVSRIGSISEFAGLGHILEYFVISNIFDLCGVSSWMVSCVLNPVGRASNRF
jgi:hypothetical protein